jgi:ureidoglycolate hydrolase
MQPHFVGKQLVFNTEALIVAGKVAFRASGCQGANFAKDTWHHPLITLEGERAFLVVNRGGEAENLAEFEYPAPGYVV